MDDLPEPASSASLGDWFSFARGSFRRRRAMAVGVFCLGVAATVAYYATSKPMYLVETRILAQRQMAIPSAVRSSGGGDAPTRTAEELILRRENLLDLVKRAGLTPLPPSPFSEALGKLRSWLGIGPAPSNVDPEAALVTRLDKALTVVATEENLKISIRWRDPLQAYQIVEGALQNFLEARQTQEITAMDEAISLLQARLATLRMQLDREESKRDDSRREEPLPLDPALAARGPSSTPATPELARIKSLLEAKERAIRDMEDFRRRRLLELQAQLDEKRNVYADAHPVVIGLRKEIEGFSAESSQIGVLREQERQLREEYAAQLALDARHRQDLRAAPGRSGRDLRGAGVTQDDRVKDVRAQYLQVSERVSAAQLELDAARAGFKHRYKVIWPAEMPREPVSPNPWKVFPIGFLASLLLALAVAVLPDVRSRRLFEAWQVERELEIEVLSDLSRR